MNPHVKGEAEHRLLLALLGCRKESLDRDGMQSLFRQVNWRNFLGNTSQDLYPYLAFRLEQCVESVGTRPELEVLARARRLTAVQNLRLRHELGKAIEVLRQSDIPTLALKGIVLAHSAYPDPSLRPMSDLDILVPAGEREKAVRALETVGFAYPVSVRAMNRDHCWRLAPEQEYAPPLRLNASSVLLEVHSQLDCSEPVLPMPVREVWSRSVVVDLNGLKVRTLCPEDFLFHLCLHQSRWHRFEKGLLPLVDLRVLLDSRPDWMWTNMATRSLRNRCAPWMYLTLEAARDLVGASVPDTFFETLPRPPDLPSLLDMAKQQICAAKSQGLYLPLISNFLAEPSWRGRVRILSRRMRLVKTEELGPRLSVIGMVQGAWLFYGRLVATVKTRIPLFIRAWKNGELRVSAFRKNARLMSQANTLFRMLEQGTGGVRNDDRVGSE